MSHVKAIAMDMNTNYSQAVKDLYPSIEIVYDTFHIIKWYNDQVVDSLRRQEAGRLRKLADSLISEGKSDEAAAVEQERRLLFGARFLLLANNRTLEAKDRLNRQLNAEAKEAALKDGRNLDDVAADGLTMQTQRLRYSVQTRGSRMQSRHVRSSLTSFRSAIHPR